MKTRKRIGALFLSVVLAAAQLPTVTMAESSPPKDGSIAAFAELERTAAMQTVEAGTAYEDLILPDTVTASVYHVTEDAFIPDEDADWEINGSDSLASPGDAAEKASGSNAGHLSGKDGREPDVIITVSEEEIPVEWEASPAYDGNIPGEYLFTAEVTGHAMSERAAAPQITVTVLPKLLVNHTLVRLITGWTFEATDYSDYAAGQLVLGGAGAENQADFGTVAGMLPKQISAEIQGESGSVMLDIPQWLCPEYRQDSGGNWPVSGSYTFTAVLPEGYDLAEGAARPEITVVVGGANVLLSTEPHHGLEIAFKGSISSKQDGSVELRSGSYTITGTWKKPDADNPSNAVISISKDAICDITLNGVTIDAKEGNYGAFALGDGAKVTLTLADGSVNVLKSGSNSGQAGLEVGEGSELTINGSGELDATGGVDGMGGAGIGSRSYRSAGTIIIESGTIMATGINGGAGIGGGGNGMSGPITINGGTVTATGAEGGAGIGGGDGGEADVTINGGTIIAGSEAGAGIGGGFSKGGDVKITGGRITANSESGAGIGPGKPSPNSSGSAAGKVTISGGMVTANSTGSGAAGIGGEDVSFSTGENGKAVIIASSIVCKDRQSSENGWRGVIIEGSQGKVYGGEITPAEDFTIPQGKTLTIPSDSSLTVKDDLTMTIEGEVVNNGTITNNGTINGSGTLKNYGSLSGSGAISGNIVWNKSALTLQVSEQHPSYGSKVTLTAVIEDMSAVNSLQRNSIPEKTVYFYRNNEIIGQSSIADSGEKKAVLEVALNESGGWNADNEYTLKASYTGGNGNLLPSESNEVKLNVKKGIQAVPSVQISYEDERLTGFEASGSYTVNGSPVELMGGGLAIAPDWFGTDISIVKKAADANYGDSAPQSVSIPFRRGAPGTPVEVRKTKDTVAVTNLDMLAGCQFSIDGNSWNTPGIFSGLTAGTGYTLYIRYKATGQEFASAAAQRSITTVNENGSATVKPNDSAASGGSVITNGGKKVTVENGTDTTTITPPKEGDIIVNAEGMTVVPGGSTVQTGNGPVIVLPEGGTLKPDGSIVLPTDGTVLVGSDPVITVTLPEGGSVEINEDGKIVLPEGAVISTGNGKTVTVPKNGGILNPADGKMTPNTQTSTGGGSSSGSSSTSAPKTSYTAAGAAINQKISVSDLRQLADTNRKLTLSSDAVSMNFAPAALKAVLAAVPAAVTDITFAAVPADLNADSDAAALIGSRPVYNFSVSYVDNNGNTVAVRTDFPAGAASVSLNYTPDSAEAAGNLFLVYVDGKKAVTWIDRSGYSSGRMLGQVPHFSVYGVAYKAPTETFADTADHWAKEDMEFAVARGLLTGTGNGRFAPDAAVTRGTFVTALGRLEGINPDSFQSRSFTDVEANAACAPYAEWAVQNQIIGKTGETLFSPDAPVTREEMAVIMADYTGKMGDSISAPLAAVTFADSVMIRDGAAEKVRTMQRAGIVKGRKGGSFAPQEYATRAEVCAVLRRFVEVTADPATARGWKKNDSGVWQYFYPNGSMALNTNIDGYEIGADGEIKE